MAWAFLLARTPATITSRTASSPQFCRGFDGQAGLDFTHAPRQRQPRPDSLLPGLAGTMGCVALLRESAAGFLAGAGTKPAAVGPGILRRTRTALLTAGLDPGNGRDHHG